MSKMRMTEGPRSWQKVSELYERMNKEHLSPQRVGQIGRIAEEKIKLALVDVAVAMGVISDDEAKRISEATTQYLRSVLPHVGRAMGERDSSELQLLLPFQDSFFGNDAGAD